MPHPGQKSTSGLNFSFITFPSILLQKRELKSSFDLYFNPLKNRRFCHLHLFSLYTALLPLTQLLLLRLFLSLDLDLDLLRSLDLKRFYGGYAQFLCSMPLFKWGSVRNPNPNEVFLQTLMFTNSLESPKKPKVRQCNYFWRG